MMPGIQSGSGFTIFCDDIRNEVGGKISFVGVYRQTLFVHGDFPFTLPKFALSVAYFEAAESLPTSALLHVYLPGDDQKPSIEGELKFAQGAAGALPLPTGEAPKLLGVHADIIIAPLVLKAEGEIRVRALRDGKDEVTLGRLFIRKAPLAEPKPGA